MTTYTTPHFANGLPERNVRTALEKETNNTPRAARPAVYREPALAAGELAEARTPDWQPAAKGMPKAAIGALGAALVGGAALAFVLLSPSTVSKPLNPNLVAAAAPAQGSTANASTGSTDGAAATNDAAPAAATATPADAATPTTTEQRAQSTADAAKSAATQAATPPVATAPVAQAPVNKPVTHAARRAQSQDAAPTSMPAAPVATPDVPVAPPQAVTPQVEPSAPAMQQTPDSATVAPAQPATPAPDTGTPPAPAPTPGDGQ